jgi:hypothetical protein
MVLDFAVPLPEINSARMCSCPVAATLRHRKSLLKKAFRDPCSRRSAAPSKALFAVLSQFASG